MVEEASEHRRQADTAPQAARPGAWTRAAWAGIVLVVSAYPPLAALHREGLQGAFRYFAADAFYYLSVADRSVDHPFFTFDGIHATSGFHPLWQVFLERSFALLGLEAAGQISFTLVASVVFVALGTALFAWVLIGLTRRPWLALLAVVPGAYYLLVPTLDAHHFAQWSFANGMESPFTVFFFGVLLVGLFERGWLRDGASVRPLVALSVVLTALVMSRLDDVFVFVPVLLWALASGGSRRAVARRVGALVAVPTVVIGAYLVYNVVQTGSPLPSSGLAKAQPLWALGRNLYALWMTVLPFADPMGRGPVAWSSEAWRVLQMLVPAGVAAAWLLGSRMVFRSGEGDAVRRENGLVGVLAAYVIVKVAYNFSTVALWDQGQWYYPAAIMVFDLIVALAAARWLDRRAALREATPGDADASLLERLRAAWPSAGRLGAALPGLAALAVVLVSANAFVDLKQNGRHQSRNFEFWLERSAIRHELARNCDRCGVLAFDDGIVAYSLEDTPTLNGLGLVLDREARAARDSGRLLELAWQRGHRLLVSVNYGMPEDAYRTRTDLEASLRANRHLAGESLDDWTFDVAFQSRATGVSFVRFQPRAWSRLDEGIRRTPAPAVLTPPVAELGVRGQPATRPQAGRRSIRGPATPAPLPASAPESFRRARRSG